MSVRRIKRRDPKTGALRQFWMVDVVFAGCWIGKLVPPFHPDWMGSWCRPSIHQRRHLLSIIHR